MSEKEITIKVKHNIDGSIDHSIIFDKTMSVFSALQALGTSSEKLSQAIYNKFPKQTKMSTEKLNEFLLSKTINDLA